MSLACSTSASDEASETVRFGPLECDQNLFENGVREVSEDDVYDSANSAVDAFLSENAQLRPEWLELRKLPLLDPSDSHPTVELADKQGIVRVALTLQEGADGWRILDEYSCPPFLPDAPELGG